MKAQGLVQEVKYWFFITYILFCSVIDGGPCMYLTSGCRVVVDLNFVQRLHTCVE